MQELLSILIGFVLGIAASWVFWRYLVLLRPDIRVSPFVLRGPSRTSPGKIVSRIKVVNLGSRQAIDLQATCSVCKATAALSGGERWVTLKHLPLNDDPVLALGPRSSIDDFWGISPFFIFHTNVDVQKLLTDDTRRLLFTLRATDALSGTTVVQRVSYTAQQIAPGDFARGLDFALLEDTPEIARSIDGMGDA